MSDRVFVNGKVFTGRSEDDFVTAFRITDGVFSWVGGRFDETGRAVQQPIDRSGAEVVDLRGRTVLPGLVDAHHHPTSVAALASGTSLLPPSVAGIGDVIERLREHPLASGDGDDGDGDDEHGTGGADSADAGAGGETGRKGWILGWGYDESRLAERRQLTRADLDEVSTRQAVLVRRSDGHTASVNSVALRLAGITRDTVDPAGARFERDENGDPNGILTEIAAVEAVESACPPPSRDDLVAELVRVGEHLAGHGIVAVCDTAATMIDDPLGTVRAAQAAGFPQRAGLYLEWTAIADDPPQLTDDDRSGRVRIAGVKLFMDGTVSNRTAWMTRPYRGPTAEYGGPTAGDDELRAALEWARANGVQVAVHAMGDAAIGHVIDVLGDEAPWLGELASVRIEHASILTDELTRRLAEARMSFAVVSHSIFYFAEYDNYRDHLTTRQRLDTYPLLRLYEQMPAAALSSDCPYTAWSDADNVFTSLQAAVDRRAHTGDSLGYDQALTVAQALLLYTSRAVRCAPFEGLGEIAVGGSADFVILASDVFGTPPAQLGSVTVAETYIDGRRVYARASAQHAASGGVPAPDAEPIEVSGCSTPDDG